MNFQCAAINLCCKISTKEAELLPSAPLSLVIISRETVSPERFFFRQSLLRVDTVDFTADSNGNACPLLGIILGIAYGLIR